MTIAINDIRRIVQYTATAGQTVFTVPFEFYGTDNLDVYNGSTLLTYNASPTDNTEYSLTGVEQEGGGTIVLGTGGAALNDIITIVSDLPVKRLTDFPASGPFQIGQLNQELDQITIMVAQNETALQNRVLRIADFDTPETLTAIPDVATRANKTLGFDGNGQPTAVDGTITGVLAALAGVPLTNNTMFYIDNAGDGQTVAFSSFSVTFMEDLASLSDPDTDALFMWDDSAGSFVWLSVDAVVNQGSRATTRVFSIATDTLLATDAFNVVRSDGAVAATVTIPLDTFQEGDVVQIEQNGTGIVTVEGAGGVTILSRGNVYSTTGQNSLIAARCKGNNIWILGGDLRPVVRDTFAVSDELSAISATGIKTTVRAPADMRLVKVKCSLTGACTTGTFTCDVKVGGVSVFTTLVTIDATEKTSETAAIASVIDVAQENIDDDEEITLEVTNVGDGTATGLKFTLIWEE